MPEPTEGNNSGTTPNNTDGNTPKPIEFTPEQQAAIDKIIADRLNRERSKSKAELDALAAQKAELEAKLATPNKKNEPNADGTKLSDEQVAEFKRISEASRIEVEAARKAAEAKAQEAKAATDRLINFQKEIAITKAADKANFIDPSVVVQLVKDKVVIGDDGKMTIVGDNGEQRMNASYQALSLDEFMQEFAQQRKYLVRSDTKTGVGSTATNMPGSSFKVEDIFGPKSNSVKAMDLKKSNPTLYKAMKERAVKEGLLAG